MTLGAPDADLLGVGTVCAVGTCGVRDFLPFTCSACGVVTCGEHRADHGCKISTSARVLVCPVCAKAVKLLPGADPADEAVAAAAFDAHARSQACDPANYARVHHKPRCPAPGCRERLGPSNALTCSACGSRVCLRHRHGDDHACTGKKAASTSSPGAAARATVARWFGCVGGSVGGAPPPVSAREAAAAAAARRLAGSAGGGAQPRGMRPQSAGGGAAACPVCARRFDSRRDLATHHAAAHPGAPPLPSRCVIA